MVRCTVFPIFFWTTIVDRWFEKQRRFWGTHVNWNWTFWDLERWFWTNFRANRLHKRKGATNVFKHGRKSSSARAWKLSSRLFSRANWLPLGLRGCRDVQAWGFDIHDDHSERNAYWYSVRKRQGLCSYCVMVVLKFVVLKTKTILARGVLRISRAGWSIGGKNQNNKSPRDPNKTEKMPGRIPIPWIKLIKAKGNSCPGLEKSSSESFGQVDFLVGRVTFKAYLPNEQGSRQPIKSLTKPSKKWPQASELLSWYNRAMNMKNNETSTT